MYGRRRTIPRRHLYLPVLIVISLIALLLPSRWTGGLISLVQIVVPFQHAATAVADAVGGGGETGGRPVSAAEHQAVLRQKAALEHQVTALAATVTDLQRDVELLTATRRWDVAGGRLGSRGRLIPARVITDDLLSWRSSRLLNAGSLQGVKRGASVTSQFFTIDRGKDDGVRDGLAILLREVLIGIADQVGTNTARVKLLSDVSVRTKVRIGRLGADGFTALDQYFLLTGHGGGIMQIRGVDRREVREGRIQIDDVVLSDPMSEMLPSAMTIGRITSIEPDLKNPLLSNLTVTSAIDETNLRRVYVFDAEGG